MQDGSSAGAGSNPAATPLMRQYHAVKQQVPGALLVILRWMRLL